MTINIKSIFANFKSPFVTRMQLQELTGGLIHPKTLRNLDSQGKGIANKFRIGPRKVGYPVADVIKFLEEKVYQNNNTSATPITKGSETINVNSEDSSRYNKQSQI